MNLHNEIDNYDDIHYFHKQFLSLSNNLKVMLYHLRNNNLIMVEKAIINMEYIFEDTEMVLDHIKDDMESQNENYGI